MGLIGLIGPVSGPELVIVLVLVLLVFGSTKLPKLARSLGQAQREFKEGLVDEASDDGDSGNARSSGGGRVADVARKNGAH